MIVTVFRSRLNPENADEYFARAAQMSERAKTMPGYISHKVFTAEDGERVTIVEFEDEAGQQGWGSDDEHRRAKARGREAFYQEYKLQVCEVIRESVFHREKS